jgi:NitT/TauT family transport system permease protein
VRVAARAERVAPFAFWAALVAIWQIAFLVVGWRPWLFPAPWHVAEAARALVSPRAEVGLAGALVVSVVRLAVGFAASVAIAVPFGFAMARNKTIDRVLGGVFLGVQTLPSVCWAPLAVLTFGLGEGGILFVTVMGSAFAVAIAFRDGVKTISPRYAEVGRMFGARGLGLWARVLFPASLPAFVSALRTGFSFAWRSLLGAELVVMLQRKGLGYLLQQGRELADVAEVVCVMATMIAIGIAVDRLVFAPLERRIHVRFGLR